MGSTSPEKRPKRSLNSPRSAEYKVLLDGGQSLMTVADGPLISVDVRDGVTLVGEGVNFDSEGEALDGVDFDSKDEFREGLGFDSDDNVSEGELTACEPVADGPTLSALCIDADGDGELSEPVAFFAAKLPPTPPPTAPPTTIAIITVRNIQKLRGGRPHMTRFGGEDGGVGTFFSRYDSIPE